MRHPTEKEEKRVPDLGSTNGETGASARTKKKEKIPQIFKIRIGEKGGDGIVIQRNGEKGELEVKKKTRANATLFRAKANEDAPGSLRL